MGELAESFREFRAWRQEKRVSQFHKNTEILENCGIKFEIKNDGYHYIHRGKTVLNFWPSSGKFRSNDGKISGFGIEKFIKLVGTN